MTSWSSPQRSLSSSATAGANTHAASPAAVNDGPTICAGKRTSGSSVTDDMVPGRGRRGIARAERKMGFPDALLLPYAAS